MIPYNLKLLTYLAPSNVCIGVGVFSLLDIPKDTCIFTAEQSYKVLWSEINPEIRSRIETLTYCDDEGFWIDCDLNKIGPQYYINHSHSPNVAYNKDTGSLYAIRDIQKNEELVDYYFPGERDWHI
jgi:SET domain-containing protein